MGTQASQDQKAGTEAIGNFLRPTQKIILIDLSTKLILMLARSADLYNFYVGSRRWTASISEMRTCMTSMVSTWISHLLLHHQIKGNF